MGMGRSKIKFLFTLQPEQATDYVIDAVEIMG